MLYVILSLKQVPLSLKYVIQTICPYVIMSLKHVPLSLKYVFQTICPFVILSKKICFSVLKRRLLCLKPLFCLIVSVGEQR